MECNEPIDRNLRTVLAITNDWPTACGQLNSNLMATACLRANFEQCKAADAFQSFERKLAFLPRFIVVVDDRNDVAIAIFGQSIS